MINETTQAVVDNFLRLIQDKERNKEEVYYTIQTTLRGDGIAQKYTNKNSGGSEGFKADIAKLKKDKRIVTISIQLFSGTGKHTGNAFENSHQRQWHVPEIDEQSDYRLVQSEGFGGTSIDNPKPNLQAYIDERVSAATIAVQREYSFQRQLDEKDFKIKELILHLDYKDKHISELEARCELANKTVSDMQEALDRAQKEIDELRKETDKYKSAGLGSLTDIDLKELISTAANTLATVGGSKMAKAVIAGFSGHGSNEQQMIDKPPPIEDTPYERS